MNLPVKTDFVHGIDVDETGCVSAEDLVACLRTNQVDFAQWPISRVLDVLDAFAHRLVSKDCDIHARFPQGGVPFISQWCRRSNLEALLIDTFGSLEPLDQFSPANARRDRLYRLFPRGLAVHWLAGNVPTLGFLSMIHGILTKNANLIKVASSADNLLGTLLNELMGIFPDEPQNGTDLAKTIAVVRYERTDEGVATHLSKHANIRVIWGSDEATQAIRALPADIEVVDVVFPSRTSFIVVDKDIFDSDEALQDGTRRIARDVSVFEQKACASPHTILIENGAPDNLERFAQSLSGALETVLRQMPKQRPSEREVSAILNLRAQYDIMHQAWYPDGTQYTILSDDDVKLGPAIGNRTIYVRSFDDMQQIAPLITQKVQSVGLLATPRGEGRFMNALSPLGVQRFTTVGAMTQFEIPWDGFMIPQHMVRWVSGPSTAEF